MRDLEAVPETPVASRYEFECSEGSKGQLPTSSATIHLLQALLPIQDIMH